jgi:hypothetical protein
MSDQHSEGMQSSTVKIWKSILFTALFIVIAITFISFRKMVVGTIVRVAAYIVWSVNTTGQVIPQQILWIFLLLLIMYIAVGSFYGKRSEGGSARINASPLVGPVEMRTKWIEEGYRGTYFKWQIANLLGKVHQSIQESASRGTSGPMPPKVPPQVQAYLDAGVNTTYADYSSPGLFQKTEPTPLDIPLEQVVAYLEEQLEINQK